MSSSPARYFVLLLLCAAIALPLRSQEAPPAKQSATAKTNTSQKKTVPATEAKKAVELKKMDLSALPADAAIVLCEQVNEALDLIPKAVILRPEKYQALLDEIDRLSKQIEKQKIDNSTPPTRCLLRGKVEAGAVRLEAEFSGTAEHTDTLVSLACSQAGASSAETDGRMAQIRRSNAGGFLVRIDKPGEYHIKLDLLLPLAGREGNSRGFELTLPRAVITQLELDLPANCTDVRLGSQPLKDLQLPGLELKNNHLSGSPGLGPVDKLDLSWKETRQFAGDPVRTAEGRIRVRLDASGVEMEADLLLAVEGTATNVWRLLVPRNAEIKILPSDKEARIEHRIDTTDREFASLRTIHLKEARSEPLHVQVKMPLVPLRGSVIPVGPFFVLGAVRQTGTVQVRNQVRNLHLDYRGHGDMQLRRQEAEETKVETPTRVATLVYSNIPLVEKPEGTVGPKSLSWLDVEAVKVSAQVRMRVAHTLTLRSEEGSRGTVSGKPGDRSPSANRRSYWHIVTTITPATKWADVEQLKILVPPEWEPSDENISIAPNSNPRSVTIPSSLLREAPTQAQRLEGRYKSPYQAEEHAVLKLPLPQGNIESCELKIESPADAEVIVNNAEQMNLELSKQPRPNEQTWRSRGTPSEGLGIDVSWRSYQPELRAMSVVDLTLNGTRGEVRHELRLLLPQTAPPFIYLRVPAAVGDSLRIQDEQGRDMRSLKSEIQKPKPETASSSSDSALRVPVAAQDGGKELRLALQYTTRLGEKNEAFRAGEPFAVPLVTPEKTTASDVKVRIWSEPGVRPRAASPRWEERNIEAVKDRALPVLVLHANTSDTPLRLIWGEQEAGFSALVERAVMHVQLEEGGAQSWRAGFQLRQIGDRNLDILMPAPVATLNAQFVFNHHKVTPELINSQGERNAGGNIARLHLPPLYPFPEAGADKRGGRQTALLDVSFQSPPGRSGGSPLHTTLQPPQILRATTVPICWQVSVPANRVLIAPESGPGVERSWTRRGWLLAASLLEPTELRHESEPAALLRWQDPEAPLVLTHAPQVAWWLVCSLGLLVAGLALYWSAWPQTNDGGRPAVWFWPLLAVLTLAATVAALFWPTMLCAILYGCEPGAVVLLAVLIVQWLMHQRYRRQIVFLSSFDRGRAGSSLIRKSPSHRPQSGEPSTVDAPPPSVG